MNSSSLLDNTVILSAIHKSFKDWHVRYECHDSILLEGIFS